MRRSAFARRETELRLTIICPDRGQAALDQIGCPVLQSPQSQIQKPGDSPHIGKAKWVEMFKAIGSQAPESLTTSMMMASDHP